MHRLPVFAVIALIAHTARPASSDDTPVASDENAAVCGNGVVEGDEDCDDGNTRDHDGCDASCQPEPLWGCGNAILDPSTACDDDGEACMATCQIDSFSHVALERAPTHPSTPGNTH